MKIYFDDPEYDGQFLRIQYPTFVAEAETTGAAAEGRICTMRYKSQKNTCSLQQAKALASTARRAAAKYFFKRCLDGSIPS